MAKNTSLDRRFLSFLSDLGALSLENPLSDGTLSNATINNNLNARLLSALPRLLFGLGPGAVQSVLLKKI